MYGFSFGKPLGLCGTGDALEARRTCKDFCSALKKILEEESALIQLIKQIDEFIWKIRENFSYTLLALWSLSLLYLLHIAVDARGKALDDIEERQKTLKDLQGKLEGFIGKENDKSNNPAKQLLENLTGGLEKFLGFNPDSKGYSGTGIVYSDLDRLCDGVMSFLHGVLHNIKPKLGLHNHRITEAIRLLNTHKHSGKEGFNAAIGKVVSGVREYNEGVRESNNAISSVIRKFNEYMKQVPAAVKSMQDYNSVNQIDEKVSECLMEAQQYYHGMDAQKSSNIKDLQNELEKDVNNATELIRYQRGRLSAIWTYQQKYRKAVEHGVTQALGEAKGQINSTAAQRIRIFVSEVNRRIGELKQRVETVDGWLKHYIEVLDSCIDKADAAVERALGKVMDIFNEAKGISKTRNREKLEQAVNELKEKALALYEAYETAEGKLGPLVQRINKAVQGLDAEIVKGVKQLKIGIDGAIRGYVEDMVGAVIEAAGETKLSGSGITGGVDALKKDTKLSDGLKALLQSPGANNELITSLEYALFGLKYPGGSAITSEPDPEKLITALSEDIKGKVAGSINGYLQTGDVLKKKMPTYSTHIESTITPAISNLSAQVLQPIKDAVSSHSADRSHITSVSGKITGTHLEAFCTAIIKDASQGGESANNILAELKNKLVSKYNAAEKGSLKELHSQLGELQNQKLHPLIKEVEEIIRYAEEHCELMITELSDHVQQRIQQAENSILENVRTTYVTFIKLQVEEFAAKVTKELSPLPTQITDEENKSYKGFMKQLHKFSTSSKLSETLRETTTLHVCLIVHAFFNTFIDTLNNSREIMPVTYLSDLQNKLSTLFTNLSKYDTTFQTNLSALHSLLSTIRPASYATESNPLLDVLTKGLTGMHDELQKAYVSVYDSQPWQAAHENKYAKVCLTITSQVFGDLHRLRLYCKSDGQFKKINSHNNNVFGAFFTRCGYDVSNHQNEQNGELRNTIECNGNKIHGKLTGQLTTQNREQFFLIRDEDDKTNEKDYSILKQLVEHLHRYRRVSHLTLPQSPKTPTSIYDILRWLSGLPHSAVYPKLKDYMKTLFPKTESQKTMLDSNINPRHLTLSSHPEVTAEKLHTELDRVCRHADRTLVAILGTGHSNGIYASDFSNNSHGFLYSSNTISLICTLFDFLKHLYQQLHFLLEQCRHTTALSGWSDCYYGNGVAGSGWQCNRMRCPNQSCDQAFKQAVNQSSNQRANQTADQNTNQTCDQHPKCGLKSPLQSFLEDGLQGFLPHSVSVKGTGLTCSTCPMSRGMPCKMPMGLPEIAVTASHIKRGEDIVSVLDRFCGRETSCLSALCSMLNCLLPSAPKSLGDMLSFYYCFLDEWTTKTEHRKHALEAAVRNANFKNLDTSLDLSNMFKSKGHAKYDNTPTVPTYALYHQNGDLYSIMCPDTTCYTAGTNCGSYVSPIVLDTYRIFSSKNKAAYLSWIVYLTETFYDLLQKLLKDCESNCCSPKSKCRIRGCHEDCTVYTGAILTDTPSHWPECHSILQCRMTLPTLCRYGFTYANRRHLAGHDGKRDIAKRSCKDFVKQLEIVTGGKSILSKLIHKTIPEFLWKIREPFSITLLALWSLSLLYLLHIAVVRLDVLRIRSHLRSPSSHRIAAQSLLAAARVRALANVKYFSP
ncbi:hypothetical protein, conserved [Babesia ovata]|uniref:C3H1-type domain-containing protein n=1 Tax=Babesia ovata TaxID=189622 RepID=A0A2H6KJQ8_9APIC|nr:uncharacterized protein BOVATA_047110 [Babesia ovata]GBE63218.1 hypothetical protein, conserved [Babesia ovata]